MQANRPNEAVLRRYPHLLEAAGSCSTRRSWRVWTSRSWAPPSTRPCRTGPGPATGRERSEPPTTRRESHRRGHTCGSASTGSAELRVVNYGSPDRPGKRGGEPRTGASPGRRDLRGRRGAGHPRRRPLGRPPEHGGRRRAPRERSRRRHPLRRPRRHGRRPARCRPLARDADAARRRRGMGARRPVHPGRAARVTFGLLLILEDLMRLFWGGLPLSADPIMDAVPSLRIGGLIYPGYYLVVIAIGVVAAVALWLGDLPDQVWRPSARDVARPSHGLGARPQRRIGLCSRPSRSAASWRVSAAPSSCRARRRCWAWASTR